MSSDTAPGSGSEHGVQGVCPYLESWGFGESGLAEGGLKLHGIRLVLSKTVG